MFRGCDSARSKVKLGGSLFFHPWRRQAFSVLCRPSDYSLAPLAFSCQTLIMHGENMVSLVRLRAFQLTSVRLKDTPFWLPSSKLSIVLIKLFPLTFFFLESIYRAQHEPWGAKKCFPYPCWDWISILQGPAMPLFHSGKPRATEGK